MVYALRFFSCELHFCSVIKSILSIFCISKYVVQSFLSNILLLSTGHISMLEHFEENIWPKYELHIVQVLLAWICHTGLIGSTTCRTDVEPGYISDRSMIRILYTMFIEEYMNYIKVLTINVKSYIWCVWVFDMWSNVCISRLIRRSYGYMCCESSIVPFLSAFYSKPDTVPEQLECFLLTYVLFVSFFECTYAYMCLYIALNKETHRITFYICLLLQYMYTTFQTGAQLTNALRTILLHARLYMASHVTRTVTQIYRIQTL